MVKLLLAILVFVILLGISVSMYAGKHSHDSSNSDTPQYSSPADTVNGASRAVDETKDLQNDINTKAAEQLNQ